MQMITHKRSIRYVFLILGLVAYTFAGLTWNMAVGGWVAPIFVLYFARNSRWSEILILYLGMACSAALSKSAENLAGIFLLYVTTGLSHGLFQSLPFILDKILLKGDRRFISTLIFPAAVVLIEYVLSLLIGIWGNGSIAHYHNFYLIQITSVFGIFGISFLVAWLASIINWLADSGFKVKSVIRGAAIYGVILTATVLFGAIRTGSVSSERETVNVAAIVGESDAHSLFEEWEQEIRMLSKDYDRNIPADIFSRPAEVSAQIEKTEQALIHGARIVVWNEFSLILNPGQVEILKQQISMLSAEFSAYVLIAFLEENANELPKPFNNTSLLYTPGGEIAWETKKRFLNPLENLIINRGETSIPYMDTEFGRISNVICADLDLTGYISQVGKNRVDILLVPAFDWEEIITYHSHMAAFAAIQYGVSVVRSNGKGIVAFYDCYGNLIFESNTLESPVEVHYAEIPVNSVDTAYSTIGNLLVYLLILFLVVVSLLRIFKT